MNRISHFLFACVFLAALLPPAVRCDEEEPEAESITLENLVPECFKAFQAAAAGSPFNIKLIVANSNQFGASAPIGKGEFQFYNSQVMGQITLASQGLMTKINRRFKLKGFFGFESVLQIRFPGVLKKGPAIDACTAIASDLAEFLVPKIQFKLANIVDQFKTKFEEQFGADKQVELVEVPLGQGQKTEEQTSQNRELSLSQDHLTSKPVKVVARVLADNKFDRSVFKLVSPSKKILGQVDFTQVSEWIMVVNVKVLNQFSAKTFVSFSQSLEKAMVPVEGLLTQMKDIKIVDELQSSDLEGLIKKVMTNADCVDPTPEITSADNYSVTSWVRGQKVQAVDAAEAEGFDRRLAGENCPFDVLTIAFDRVWIDGFPSLQVYFEGNTKFPVPIYLDYFLTVKSKAAIEERVQGLFSKFVEVFKVNEEARKIEAQKEDEFDQAIKDYEEKVKEDAPGSEFLKMPKKPEVPAWTMQQASQEVQKMVFAAHAKAGGNLNVMFVMNGAGSANVQSYMAKDGAKTLMLIDILKDVQPRVKVTFYYYPNDKNERSTTYQMDISSDPRLKQVVMMQSELEKYFSAPWKKARDVV